MLQVRARYVAHLLPTVPTARLLKTAYHAVQAIF